METPSTTVGSYIRDLFLPPDPQLEAALQRAAAAGLRSIQVPPELGRLLGILVQATGARRVLEIGTLGGYSAIWLARALPPDGRLITLEVEPKHAAVASMNFVEAGLSEQIEIRLGPALESLERLVTAGEGPFDLVFIDADKPAYDAYLEWAIRLSRPGTLIVADNVVQRGAVVDEAGGGASVQAVRQFNRTLAAHPRLDALIVPLLRHEIDGMALAVVRGEG